MSETVNEHGETDASGVTDRPPERPEHGFDGRPARTSALLGVAAATLSTLATLPAPLLFPLAGVGTLAVAVGAFRGRRAFLTVGAVLLVVAHLASGLFPVDPLWPLVGAAAAFVGWDCGEYAVGLGEQVGRRARTRHAELTHAATSSLVAVLAVVVGYSGYWVGVGGRPVVALVLLLVGTLVLVRSLSTA